MATIDDELWELAERLGELSERLADLALDQLRTAADPDADPESTAGAQGLERRLTRARRSIEKAAGLLRPRAAAEADEPV